MLGSVLMIMLFGFITGSLARLAVPGPDPMPIWLTIAIGLVGSGAGGGLAIALWGKGTQGIGIFSFLGAVLLVVAYRRFVQKRPIVGPEAFRFPVRGIGIDRFQERRSKMEDMLRQAQAQQASAATESNLQKLRDLHEAGILTDEEFEAKKALLEGR
ncbi:MAG TPA: SHOCT domain-containing protein [Gaiellaceae bacterium]|nr:SHOCT domain-containing protein [Gaiellaceae bacterium]HWJ44261.1 SHOCT domain-containing protein [Gaiellaceae bacterium]